MDDGSPLAPGAASVPPREGGAEVRRLVGRRRREHQARREAGRGTKQLGHDVVVVISAMGDTTDELMDLALQVTPQPPPRELDMLLTAGERMSAALLAMAIADQGLHARSLTGRRRDHHHPARTATRGSSTSPRAASPRRSTPTTSSSSPASRASPRTPRTSPRWGAAPPTPPPSRSPRRWARTTARSTPTSTASTPPTRASCRARSASPRSPTRRCSRWRRAGPRSCTCAAWSTRGASGCPCRCAPRSPTSPARGSVTLSPWTRRTADPEGAPVEQAIISGVAHDAARPRSHRRRARQDR